MDARCPDHLAEGIRVDLPDVVDEHPFPRSITEHHVVSARNDHRVRHSGFVVIEESHQFNRDRRRVVGGSGISFGCFSQAVAETS
jgi:hypothetical protein